MGTPSFHKMKPDEQRRLAQGMVKTMAYAAELVRDDWYQSAKLGQRPLVAPPGARRAAAPPRARPGRRPADDAVRGRRRRRRRRIGHQRSPGRLPTGDG